MKKLLYSYLLSSLTLGFGFFQPISAFAQQIDHQTNVESKKDIIEWKYKIENGKLYKRLYNASKDEWIGNWILA